ncbi:HPr kinase/phosphorylase [Dongia sedimenti]|uniref:HPr kinase/phosphatase C-terminal domain-containing protein n=1 Tax=Dongia sedimenti TaxID=3064282 RepID=A0ABU0YP15_9PROT|nr:HPr kinase/phosphatase C-terminal domain-containing protein [Rhodospirillaceae bacterium R-7]
MSSSDSLAIDGTAIAIGNAALLLTGPSGSGKSDLALRMIDGGARLIADDRVELVIEADRLCCRVPSAMPANLLGRIEVRGIGIVPAPRAPGATPLQWVVELVPAGEVERMPAAESRAFLGHAVPLLRLAAFEASTAVKLRLAAACGPGLIMGRE